MRCRRRVPKGAASCFHHLDDDTTQDGEDGVAESDRERVSVPRRHRTRRVASAGGWGRGKMLRGYDSYYQDGGPLRRGVGVRGPTGLSSPSLGVSPAPSPSRLKSLKDRAPTVLGSRGGRAGGTHEALDKGGRPLGETTDDPTGPRTGRRQDARHISVFRPPLALTANQRVPRDGFEWGSLPRSLDRGSPTMNGPQPAEILEPSCEAQPRTLNAAGRHLRNSSLGHARTAWEGAHFGWLVVRERTGCGWVGQRGERALRSQLFGRRGPGGTAPRPDTNDCEVRGRRRHRGAVGNEERAVRDGGWARDGGWGADGVSHQVVQCSGRK